MIYKTLNNWVAKAFITELSRKHYKACIYIYMNNYALLSTSCWERLLDFFFNNVNVASVYFDIRDNQILKTYLKTMISDYEAFKEL